MSQSFLHKAFSWSFALMFLAISAAPPAHCVVAATADQITARAVKLYDQGRIDEASKMEQSAIDKSPEYWLPHAVQSCLAWQSGNGTAALSESETALKLAPENGTVLYNAGVFHHLLGMYEKAGPFYLAAMKRDPTDWQAAIGYTQVLCLQGKTPEALRMLDRMANSDHGSFDWWFQLGGMYCQLKEYKRALAPLKKAVAMAPEQEKQKAQSSLFLATVKAGDSQSASALEHELIMSGSKDPEIYTESAEHLSSDPKDGEWLLAQAKHRIGKYDSTFYELSKIFLNKSRSDSDPKQKQAWLSLSETAIRWAIAKGSNNTNYRWALVAVLDDQGRTKEIETELSKISIADSRDKTAPVLLRQLRAQSNDIAGRVKTALRSDTPGPDNAPSYKLTLSEGKLRIKKLTCNCHTNLFVTTLAGGPGALCATADKSDAKHPVIKVYFDPSQTTFDALVKLVSKMQDESEPVGVQPVTSIAPIVEDMQRTFQIQHNSFAWVFRGGEPRMPALASNSKSSSRQ